MGEITTHKPVLLITAITSRNPDAFAWSLDQMIRQWGPIAKASPVFDFTETDFYTQSMGSELKKQFVAFEQLIDPGEIALTKHLSNRWEGDYATHASHPEQRPLNLDPGYISEAKLVLVTTKDRDHRIYLQQGVFAEVTLHYRGKTWTSSRWTYPDYQRADFQAFFTDCREYLRNSLRNIH